MLSRASEKLRWVLKQRLKHTKSHIRDAWKGWVLKQGLNYVKSRIREVAAQSHTESPPAAFLLRASLAVSKAKVGA